MCPTFIIHNVSFVFSLLGRNHRNSEKQRKTPRNILYMPPAARCFVYFVRVWDSILNTEAQRHS